MSCVSCRLHVLQQPSDVCALWRPRISDVARSSLVYRVGAERKDRVARKWKSSSDEIRDTRTIAKISTCVPKVDRPLCVSHVALALILKCRGSFLKDEGIN